MYFCGPFHAMLYQERIQKETLALLPLESYNGPIRVLNQSDLTDEIASILHAQWLIGFDTETRPSFRKGEQHQVSLIQLACQDECFLIRLDGEQLSPIVRDLFNSPSIIKVGLSSKDDFHHLRAISKGFQPRNVVELQSLVPNYGIRDMSLQKIYAIVFGKRISKAQQLSNWEAETLTEAQQHYAALDAWAVRQLYLRLTESDVALRPSSGL